jgi:alcohol dehydrogenase (NADP+)
VQSTVPACPDCGSAYRVVPYRTVSSLTPSSSCVDFAIQFAKALGARVVVFSHSPSKKDDCLSLGADEFVTTDKEGFEKPFFDKIDYILSCADVETIPLGELASTLKVGGLVTSVGLPDGEWKGLQPQLMASNGSSIGCSHIGSKKEA